MAGALAVALLIALIASVRVAWSAWRDDTVTAAPTPAASPSVDGTPSAEPSPAPEPEPSPTVSKRAFPREPITLSFAGDTHFEAPLNRLLTGPANGVDALTEALSAADFTMINLETAITTGGKPIPGKTYTFRAPPSALTWLQGLGVDAVSLANNHAADYGASGLQDTLAAKANSPIAVIGVGANRAEAFAPVSVEIKGVKIAMITSSQLTEETSELYGATNSRPGISTNNTSNDALLAAVAEAKATHDVVVVFLHWGTETMTCPDQRQKATAQALADAGVDAVVGGHAHRVQGSGWSGKTFVDWGMGNFIWYNFRGASGYTGVLTITVDGGRVADREEGKDVGAVVTEQRWQPMIIGSNGIPVPATGGNLTMLEQNKAAADKCSGLASTPN